MRRLFFPLSLVLALFVSTAGGASGAEPFRYQEGKHGKGELRYVNGVPVLILNGTPDEMGEQIGALAVRQAKPLFNFPRDYFRRESTLALGREFPKFTPKQVEAMEAVLWPNFQKIAAKLEPNFPKAHLRELDAIAKAGGLDRGELVASNGMFDLGNLSPKELIAGCSSVIIPPEQSATKGLLFGRNLDFTHFDYLHKYSLLIVYRSSDKTKHAFVSAAFPGFVGCFTGTNDAGLTVASHEVAEPITKTPFDPAGVPFAMSYRRVLEECKTVDEAVALLKGIKRASVTSLVVADVKGGAVVEVTPEGLAVRKFDNKPGVCTNHFCTDGFKNPKQTDNFETLTRFDTLSKSVAVKKAGGFGVADVQERLHAVRLLDGQKAELTIQTFVFEPASGKVHLRFSDGKGPATGGELKTLDLNELWGKPAAP